MLSDADVSWFTTSIERNGLCVDDVVCSEELGCYKPHEYVFLAACDRLRATPATTAYVGDNPHFDVVGARNADLISVWLNRRGNQYPSDLPPPHHTISSLNELPAIL